MQHQQSKEQNLSACNQSGLNLTTLFIAADVFCLCDFALKMKREKAVYLYLEKLILSTYILPHLCPSFSLGITLINLMFNVILTDNCIIITKFLSSTANQMLFKILQNSVRYSILRIQLYKLLAFVAIIIQNLIIMLLTRADCPKYLSPVQNLV